MPCSVVLVNRLIKGHPERGLDLTSLASHQKPVKVLERLHIAPPCRRRRTPSDQHRDDPVHVLRPCLPRWDLQQPKESFQHAGVVLDRGRRETSCSPRRDERLNTNSLERVGIKGTCSRYRCAGDDSKTMGGHRTPSSRHVLQGGT
jgi:hypothetical protein